ncbi:hypothetical protein L3X38_026616 [Prunus dulcis]|uniref:Uncharacterized protein n=1 Tax=Prunus dulcis TaxID=3755 RepID=A0AAD4YZL1_PRUDU|nr:hypothetical protein L3X38_026616 [Prunus dulcis]
MPYLKAVVLETLRRHPPSHFILPRAVLKDIQMDGYDIPKDAMVNFTVAEMSRDPNVWERPMEFRPERFIQTGQQEVKFDIKGVRGTNLRDFSKGETSAVAFCPFLLFLRFTAQSAFSLRSITTNSCFFIFHISTPGFLFLAFPAAGCHHQLEGSILKLGVSDEL